MKIHIIDDHALFRNGLMALLEANGIQASASASPEAGLSDVVSEGIDIILLDLRMPDISGLEVLKKIKTQNSKIMVIKTTIMLFNKRKQC